MTSEVDFLITVIREEYGAGSLPAGTGPAGEEPPLEIIERESTADEDGDRDLREDMQRDNVVLVDSVDQDQTPIGTGYDHDLETVANVRLRGLHDSQYGWIGTDKENRAPWASLKRVIRRAILRQRHYPAVERPNVGYTHLQLTNTADNSSNYADEYDWTTDVVFDGFETLPDP